MKKFHIITSYKTSGFLGTFKPKINRIGKEPRQRFRQHLRSSIPTASQARNQFKIDDQL